MLKSFGGTILELVGRRKRKSVTVIPYDLRSSVYALTVILLRLRESDKAYLFNQSSPQMFATTIHDNIGRSIRNAWGLWEEESQLRNYFKENYGIDHADDISGVISMCTWQELNNKEMTPKIFADSCIEYWRTVEESGGNGLVVEVKETGEVKLHPKE